MAKKKLGDLTSDALKAARIDRLSSAYTRITGKPCNCEQNRMRLNNLQTDLEKIINAKRTKKTSSKD